MTPDVYAIMYIGGLIAVVAVVVEVSRWFALRRARRGDKT
jgi:hypothetical protein